MHLKIARHNGREYLQIVLLQSKFLRRRDCSVPIEVSLCIGSAVE